MKFENKNDIFCLIFEMSGKHGIVSSKKSQNQHL